MVDDVGGELNFVGELARGEERAAGEEGPEMAVHHAGEGRDVGTAARARMLVEKLKDAEDAVVCPGFDFFFELGEFRLGANGFLPGADDAEIGMVHAKGMC